jgi:cell wall-associated NlpC family hydrolase
MTPRTGETVAAEAENWLGVPFKWQGRVRAGVDCKGLIAAVAGECGRPEAASLEALASGYAHKVPVAELRKGLARLFDRVTDRQPGDVLLLKVGGKPQHLAIAAPKDGQPSRTIQALHTGPQKVLAYRVPRDMVDSIWRWRD